jgi:glycerophosphoryl diester phosphodiesterase
MSWAYLDVETPFGMAHRGGKGVAPENTEAAFANARSLGYVYLETDVHRSADGVLVAFHDGELGRVGGRSGKIAELTWDELSRIDLGGGHHIPRLTDLLDTFPDARFNIDPKADDAVDLLVDAVRSRDAIDRVCIGSFSEARITRAREALGPTLCTSPGPGGLAKVLTAATLRSRWRPPYGCVQIPPKANGVSLSGRWLIGRLHAMGLQVHYWTINERDEMIRLLDNGADAIITDEIEMLGEVLEERRGRG